ncbi:hypothetical protein CsSME_00047894 [Camellia sinensis var. sinensis]
MSQSPDHSASSLYCPENACDLDTGISDPQPSGHSPPPDESIIVRLIESEPHHIPHSDYLRRCRHRSIDLAARQDSINWILRVHAHYRFRPVTAYLTVNYFDRLLSSHSLPEANGWPLQLLSVACLSLAAKMEEPYVPLLLDLQVFEPKFVFEPKTIQRMELWVMANLNWRLRSVTPFDYLEYFVSNLPPSLSIPSVLSTSSDLILNTIRVVDFLGFRPSTIAAAAVISAAGDGAGLPETFYERANREMVRSCHQLMVEYLIDTCQTSEPPLSPAGVIEAAGCRSCDTRSEVKVGLESNQAEPDNKRLRSSASDVQQQQSQP